MSDETSKGTHEPTAESTLDTALIQRALLETAMDVPDVSARVLAQYQADLQYPLPCQYDLEFLSSYLDGELVSDSASDSLLKHRILTFEQHLPQCPSCNQQLGQLFETIELVRGHLYRLESQLASFDIAAEVMNLWMLTPSPADVPVETEPLPLAGCGRYPFEVLSASLDGELASGEHVEVTEHLDQCEPCQAFLHPFTLVRDHVRQAMATAEGSNNPTLPTLDVWSAIQPQLEAASAPSGHIIPFPSHKKRRVSMVSASVAAAVLLMMFSGKVLFAPQPSFEKPVNTAALEAAMFADRLDAQRQPGAYADVTEAAYRTPEAYLFSTESDILSYEEPEAMTDAAAVALSDSL